MKKIYNTLLLVLFIFNTLIVKADFVSLNTAQIVASTYLELNGVTNSLTLIHTEYVGNGNAAMFYVFDITGGGHIIISADDRMKPIRAYVPGQNYVLDSDNPGIGVWKSWHEQYFVDSILSTTQTTRKITDWDVFINPPNNQSESVLLVGPLLSTIWDQSFNALGNGCYNDVVMSTLPGASNFIDIPVGCVSTAASQIMNYYQHPYKGVGSSTAGSSCPGVLCGMTNPSFYPLSVNHADANSTFDWSNISTGDSICLPNDQTSRLCYDVAIALNMDFDSTGSSSSTSDVDNILEDHYGYDDWAEYNQGWNNTNAAWITMLKDEIDAQRPMQYRGSGTGGGHSWVCDGYNTTSSSTTFHMNWGWGGNDNGFYAVTPFTAVINNGTYTPSNGHSIVRRIRPGTDLRNYTGVNSVSYSGNVLSHDVLNDFVDGTNDAFCNPFTIKYYASTNTTITTSDEYLGSYTRSNGLQGFRYFTRNQTIDPSTYNIPAGNYYIGWIIDSESEVWEMSESNNKGYYSSTVYFPGQSDLEIKNEHYSISLCFPTPCTTTPPVSVSGTTIDFNVEVSNDINATGTSSSTYLGYYLSLNSSIVPSAGLDHLLGSDYVASLSPGNSSTEIATFDLASSAFNSIPNGTYYIGAYADYLYTETESNENNNDAAFNWTNNILILNPTGYYQITIERGCTDSTAVNYSASANIDDGSCTYPDLEITNEHYSIILFGTTTPPVSISGTTIDFNVEVTNNGTGTAAPSQLGYYLSDNANIYPCCADHLLGTDQVDGGGTFIGLPPTFITFDLAVGGTSTETATFDLSDPSFNSIPNGTYYIGAYADYDETLSESNEWNNDAAFNWTNNILILNPLLSGHYQITIERGCTDSTAVNYSATANIDDGSCLTTYGCTDTLACNYDPTANVDDGSCVFQSGSSIDLTSGSWIYNGDSNCDTIGYSLSYGMIFNSNGTGTFNSTFPVVWSLCNDVFTMWHLGYLFTGSVVNGFIYGSHPQSGCFAITLAPVPGCTDPTALNYNPLATVDDGTCTYSTTCTSPVPTGLSVTDLTHDRAKVNWGDANTSLCLVEKYRVQYREQGTTAWSTKTALGSGLCQFGLLTTSKMLWNLTPSTVYEYRVKAWYCLSSASTWSSVATFTTLDPCPNVNNFAVSTPTNTRATFTWTAPTAPYSFVRIKLRVDSPGAPWQTAGGFGVMYPALTRNKNGLLPGESYLASSRTWCNPLGGPHKALAWSPFIYWTQPGGSIRIDGEGSTAITNLAVYPNPSRDIFNVSFVSDEVQNLEMTITNVVGEAIYTADLEQFVGQFTKEVSLDTYPKGVYFLQITTDKGMITKKLILQ